MDLLEQTKKLCKSYNIIPARSKGQNFLIKEEIYDDIIAAADLKPDETVLEVGPGLGFLTAKLAARAGLVMAVELDDKLAGVLETRLLAQGIKNVEVVNEDILDISVCHSREGTPFSFSAPRSAPRSNPDARESGNKPLFWIPGQARDDKKNYKVVANLPYNITSIFLRKYLEMSVKPELMVLMLQKEVAERITAKAGKMSLLAVSVQFYAQAEIIKLVSRDFFWPKPEVDSAIVRITPHTTSLNPPLSGGRGEEKDFFQLVKFGFSAKRKMLKNNLAAGFKIDQAEAEEKIIKAGFNGKIRAQELAVDDWRKLLIVFK